MNGLFLVTMAFKIFKLDLNLSPHFYSWIVRGKQGFLAFKIPVGFSALNEVVEIWNEANIHYAPAE